MMPPDIENSIKSVPLFKKFVFAGFTVIHITPAKLLVGIPV